MSGPGGRPRKYKTPEDFTAKVDGVVGLYLGMAAWMAAMG